MNAVADESGKIVFEVNSLDQVNGEYSVILSGHTHGGKTIVWDLGRITVWFKEGN